MANIIRRALTVAGDRLIIPTLQQAYVGFGISGTWVGTLTFRGSNDGLNFFPVSVTPFPTGTAVQTATGNGNWFSPALNLAAWDVLFTTYTSGSLLATLAASADASFQDAFLAATSQFVEQDATGGAADTITIAAQANRAWRCRTVSGGFSVAPSAAVKVTISDGASSTLWAEYVAAAAGSFVLNLPANPDAGIPVAGGGVVGSIGNSLVISVAAPGGSVATSLSAEIIPA